MLRALYNWTLSLAAHRHANWALAIVAFLESSIFPIPPDILMIAMIMAAPQKAYRIAAIATLASVLGGLAGYWIGHSAYVSFGEPLLQMMGKADLFEVFQQRYNEWGIWAVFIGGLTPFPYKVITILSGATDLSLSVFIISSIAARGLRFFIVAALLKRYGSPIQDFIEHRLGLALTLFVVLLIAGFAAASYL